MRKPLRIRRALLAGVLATGPFVTACEAVLDFDRSPLQVIPEAGVRDASDARAAADAVPDRAASETSTPRTDGGTEAAAPEASADAKVDVG